MQQELARVIEQVSKEKGIDRSIVVQAVENAMLSAAKKVIGGDMRIEAQYNPEIGEVELFKILTVVEQVSNPELEIALTAARQNLDPEAQLGDELLEKLAQSYGRIAAQAAKQNLIQRLRDAERDIIYNEFKDRKGELTHSGIVQRFEKKNIIVNLGRTDAILPEKEQIPRERYRQGDRIRAYILEVDMTSKGPQIVLSRTDPALLIKLFEQEVPEIYDGTVMIRGAVREAGDRAKVAVFSRERDVDPVGACVGMKGTRVQSIIRELRGEKIDIVEFSEDPVTFVTKALSPARVQRVSIVDDEQRVMEVMVEDRQLSLAIGKKGQNVRLAAKLTGWKIDIKSEEEKRKEVEAQLAGIDFGSGNETAGPLVLPGIHDEVVAQLRAAGYDTIDKVLEANPEELAALPNFDAETVEAIRAAAESERATRDAVAAPAESAESAESAETAETATSDEEAGPTGS